MKIEYEISKNDMQDRKVILDFINDFKGFKLNISEYGYKLLDDYLLDSIYESLEACYGKWVDDQQRRLLNIFNEKLNTGEVDIKNEDIV